MGIEIGNGVFVESEKPVENAPSVEAVEAEFINEENNLSDNEEQSAVEETNFDCPGAGLHPSLTNCADYFQCIEDGTVILQSFSLFDFLQIS